MNEPRFRLIEIDTTGNGTWQDYTDAKTAYAAQDALIKHYLRLGYKGFMRHFLDKGVGHTFQCVEIYLVYAESGRVI